MSRPACYKKCGDWNRWHHAFHSWWHLHPWGSLHLKVNHYHHQQRSIDRKSTRRSQCLRPRTHLWLLRRIWWMWQQWVNHHQMTNLFFASVTCSKPPWITTDYHGRATVKTLYSTGILPFCWTCLVNASCYYTTQWLPVVINILKHPRLFAGSSCIGRI